MAHRAATREPAGPQADPGARSWWPLVAICTGIAMLLIDITVVNVALPDIQRDLNASFDALQWVIDAYTLGVAALLLTFGSLGDRIGRRKVFIAGLIVFVLASLACGAAPNMLLLNLARLIQGVGGSIMFATSLALLGATYQGKDRGTAFGVWGATAGASVALGPLVSGLLVTTLSWRWIFLINIPIGLFAIAVSVRKLSESADPQARRTDWAGVVTFSAALGLLVYALIRGTDKGWTSAFILVVLGLAAAFLVAFVVIESRIGDPMLELGLFRTPAFTGAQIAAFVISGSLFSLLLYLTFYLQNVLGYDALQAGLRFLALSAATLVVAPLAGKLTDRVPIRILIGVALTLVGAGLLLMRSVSVTSGWTALLAGLIVAGIGAGMVNPPLGSLAVGVVEQAKSGMASGINNTFRQVGIAAGIAGYGAVLQAHISSRLTEAIGNAPLPPGALTGLSTAVASGRIQQAAEQVPAAFREQFRTAALEAFISGLDILLLIAAVVALVGAALTAVLIRQRDLVSHGAAPGGG